MQGAGSVASVPVEVPQSPLRSDFCGFGTGPRGKMQSAAGEGLPQERKRLDSVEPGG